MNDEIRITVIATGFEDEADQKDDDKIEPLKRGSRLFDDEEVPPFMKKNKVPVDYREAKPKSENLDIDDDRYDVPTFLRKQAD